MIPTYTTSQPSFNSPSEPQEMFDTLMSGLEPDLTSDNVPFLETRYVGETLAQREKRMARYRAALDVFDALVRQLGDSTKEYEAAARAAILRP